LRLIEVSKSDLKDLAIIKLKTGEIRHRSLLYLLMICPFEGSIFRDQNAF
jgi:hypothetical protein